MSGSASSLLLALDPSLPMPLVMGILNVTPDSFSDGGVHYAPAAAIEAAMRMVEEGAAIIDIGGESTRPGAGAVTVEQELARVAPVIEEIRRRNAIPISLDTRKAAVARAGLAAGANVINDVSSLRFDPEMAEVVAAHRVPVILMHMRGEPETMQQMTDYDEVVNDVASELAGFRDRAVAAGIDPARILVDPGIGFAKTFEQNLELLARCGELRSIGPVVIGASRKAFVGHLTGRPSGMARMAGSLAAVASAFRGKAAVVRVHDVRETVDFLKVMRAIEERAR
ncbi:MAG: dihydropteroate synthase [Acidobacteriota bacterium]